MYVTFNTFYEKTQLKLVNIQIKLNGKNNLKRILRS